MSGKMVTILLWRLIAAVNIANVGLCVWSLLFDELSPSSSWMNAAALLGSTAVVIGVTVWIIPAAKARP